MNKVLYLLALLIFMAGGCTSFKAGKDAGETTDELKSRSVKFLQRQLAENQFDADWFAAKAKVSYSDSYESIRFQANIRVKKDSAIWMNFRKLSIEAARLLITPDSVFIIDRINSQYLASDLGYIQRNFNLPANFQTLQSIIFGNPFFFTKDLKPLVIDNQYVLEGESARITQRCFIHPETFQLTGLTFEEPVAGRKFLMQLSDYQQVGKRNFSYFRKLNLEDPVSGPVLIDLEMSKLEIDLPKAMPFEIPTHYSRME